MDGADASENSGWSISISDDGNMVAIGAPYHDAKGTVRVYHWDGNSWTQRGLDMDGADASENSGWSISISDDGNTVAIGAPYHDSKSTVRVYHWDGNSWTQRASVKLL
jgi:hypothetical protein